VKYGKEGLRHAPHGFHPRLLKELATVLACPLTVLFQETLNEGTLPTDRKEAQVTPLFNKGDRSSPVLLP
jgi:hypothetical protein